VTLGVYLRTLLYVSCDLFSVGIRRSYLAAVKYLSQFHLR
jgi:hypothetical protein